MKKILYILTFLPIFGICQNYESIITENDSIYLLKKIDSLNTPKNLPDGKWNFYYPEINENMKVEFHLKNNMVNGEFKYWLSGKLIVTGHYLNDSLWTFYRTNGFNKDTTFMVGYWFYNNLFGWERKKYKIPFEENNCFIQILTDEQNRVESKYVWDKNFGLIQATKFVNSNKRYEFIKTEQYSIKTKWTEEDKIQSIEIIQDSLKYENNLIRSERFYNNVGISIKSINKYEDTDTNIPVIKVQNDGRQIKDVEVNDSSFWLMYLKQNGKKKYKNIK